MSSQAHAAYRNGQASSGMGPNSQDPDSELMQSLSPPLIEDEPRPAKRRRMTAALRTAIACQACRDRKTRCSGEQPKCRYCSRAGIACEYTSAAVTQPTIPLSSNSLDEWGPRILEAIGDLAQDVDSAFSSNKHYPRRQHAVLDHGDPVLYADDHELRYASRNLESHRRLESPPFPGQSRNQPCVIRLEGPTLITGSLSILQWPVLCEPDVDYRLSQIKSARTALSMQRNSSQHALQSASCSIPDLHALLACFEANLLPEFPVIKISQTKRLINNTIADHSVPWTAEACLILLVSALGAISQSKSSHVAGSQFDRSRISSRASSRTSIVSTAPERVMPVAMRYWNMAKKRLMWAISTNGQLSAQCQLLAGIYLIYTAEPVPAGKMLHGALLAINDLGEDIPDAQTSSESDSSLNQNILIAILFLICRLRSETQLPLAPSNARYYEINEKHDQGNTQDPSSPIPHRKLIQLLQIRAQACANAAITCQQLDLKHLHDLERKVSTTLKALDQWQCSLPSSWLRLDDPDAGEYVTSTTQNDRSWLGLQGLYIEARELVLRPSLFLVLHSTTILDAGDQEARNDTDPFEGILAGYLCTQLRSIASQHRSALVSRTRWCLDTNKEQVYLPEMGWLKCQTYFALGMLLVASMRLPSESPGSSLREMEYLVNEVIGILELDLICGTESRIFAEILRRHLGS